MYNIRIVADIAPNALHEVLAALGEQLALVGFPVHLVVIGGSGLVAIGSGLPAGFVDRMMTREFGSALTVSFASRIDQIHFKLYAAADRGEPRDFDDLRALEPTDVELTAAAAWARTHNAPGPFDEALARTLLTFGVQDEGRRA